MSEIKFIEIDESWDLRRDQREEELAEWRHSIVENDEYWATLPGAIETDLKIAFDRARLDAIEVCSRMELDFPRTLIDTYQIARKTAGELDQDQTIYRDGDGSMMAGNIVGTHYGMLLRMLFPEFKGPCPSDPDYELTEWFVGSLGYMDEKSTGQAII